MKKIISVVLAILLFCTVGAAFAEGPGGRGGNGGPGGGQGGMRGGNGGGTDKSSDTELQSMITEVAPKFQLLTYEDAETGTSLQYQLFIPENYDETQSYPMIQFIPDSSAVGRGTDYVLTQGWGGLIWATEEEQAKHPAFVVVPVFTETVVDDNFNHSGQIDVAMRLLQSLTSFHLSIAYPGFFAAYLFVGSQWDTSLLNGLEDENFFYIVSAGDPKASAGQAELLALFDADGAAYSHKEWSAQDDADTQNAAVAAMLAEGYQENFVTFTLGTTLAAGQTSGGGAGEHMTSFDYAYKLEAVRDWLFSQSK